MKRIILFFALFIFLLSGVFVNGLDSKIKGVEFNEEDVVEVVVKTEVKDISLLEKSSENYPNEPLYELREVTEEELEEMEKDDSIVGVYSKNYIRGFLDKATTIVKSDLSNNLKIGSLNITGIGQKVCVIDTGVNFLHPDLLGKNESCMIDCFGKSCVEDCSVLDDNGHGTHVAGIVGASGSINGIATNVTIIGVKVLGSDGGGSGNDDDLNNAVDWCVLNNASVITMSLGTVSLYDSECDSVGGLESWRDSINSAIEKNISVISASGNDGNLTHISAPACLSNTTAVGDTYDDNVGALSWGSPNVCTDSSTMLDQIVCHANRNSLVKLFAPGALINSTSNSGGYEIRGGTSMATPMVAGAFALINQYLELSGQTKIPLEIEDVLNDTGLVLDDSDNSGLYFSRINVYNALLSLDVDEPNVSLIYPGNNHINLTSNQTFICNASDWQLKNVTFSIWNSSGLYYNETKNVSGVLNGSVFNLTNMPFETYGWNCLFFDNQSNFASGLSNYSLTIASVSTNMVFPLNKTYTNNNETNFTCNSISDSNYELTNVSFEFWNSSGNSIYNEARNISGFSNSSIFNYTFVYEDNYSWGCISYNNNSDRSNEVNYSLIYDFTKPNVFLTGDLPLSETSSSVVRVFEFNVSDDNIANCSFIVNGENSLVNNSINQSVGQIFSRNFAPGDYTWSIKCIDFAGNLNSSSENNFVITTPVTVSSGSSGGGGGGGSDDVVLNKTYDVSVSEISRGHTQKVKKNEKINFSIFDFEGGRHLLIVNEVGSDYVNLTIESDPINFRLGAGQSIKLNLTSPNYYNLFVMLNNISDGEAELSIELINEPIENLVRVEEKVVFKEEKVEDENYFWVVVVLVALLIVVLVVVVLKDKAKKLKGKKTKKKSGKKKGKKRGRKKTKA